MKQRDTTHHVLELMNGPNSFPGVSMEVGDMNSEVRRIGGVNVVDESPQGKGSPFCPVDFGLPKYRLEALEHHFYANTKPKAGNFTALQQSVERIWVGEF